MEHGHRLIQQTGTPITEVAFSTGFGSPEHFSRRYRTLFDFAPSQDRRRSPLVPVGTHTGL